MTLENWFRKNSKFLQNIYDILPYTFQTLAISFRGFGLTKIRYSSIFREELQDIADRETYSKERMQMYQVEKLQEMVQLAYTTTSFYRQWFDVAGVKPEDIKNIEDLRKLPILSRDTVRIRGHEMISSAVPASERINHRTSGTTGSGLSVIVSKSALQNVNAHVSRQMQWAGVEPRDWRITMFGARVIPPKQSNPPYWVKNFPGHQIFLSGFHLSDKTIDDYYEFLSIHQDLPIEGFASTLHILSELLAKREKRLKMKAIFSNGEPMLPFMREIIEDRLGAKVWDAYGQTELVGLIQECAAGGFHLASDFGILEILDDTGNPVEKGQPGNFVWTGLQNEAMPLIRYKIGDIGEWCKEQACPCGKYTPLVHPIITRDSDYLKTPNGKIYSPRMINQYLKGANFQYCQIVQKSKYSWVIRYISNDNNADRQVKVVQSNLENLLGADIKIEIKKAISPIQREGGKIPLIIAINTPDK